MKNILLIGDSILVGSNQTSGYGTIVRDMLKDKANVHCNCHGEKHRQRQR